MHYGGMKNPSCMLGHEVTSRLTNIFRLGRHSSDKEVTKTLNEELSKIIKKAREHVNSCLPPNENDDARYGQLKYFIEMRLDPVDRPWPEEVAYELCEPDVPVRDDCYNIWTRIVFEAFGIDYEEAVRVADH